MTNELPPILSQLERTESHALGLLDMFKMHEDVFGGWDNFISRMATICDEIYAIRQEIDGLDKISEFRNEPPF